MKLLSDPQLQANLCLTQLTIEFESLALQEELALERTIETAMSYSSTHGPVSFRIFGREAAVYSDVHPY